jgi:hypothetical protein
MAAEDIGIIRKEQIPKHQGSSRLRRNPYAPRDQSGFGLGFVCVLALMISPLQLTKICFPSAGVWIDDVSALNQPVFVIRVQRQQPYSTCFAMCTSTIRFRSAAFLLFASSLAAGTPAASDKSPAPASRTGGWRVSGGFMYRSLGDIDWLTGTRSTPSLLTIGPGSNTAGIDAIGPADAFADRTYTDGFVFQDPGTPNGGDTWNWGYNNASQVSDGMLNFHGGNGTAATFTDSNNYEYGGWSSDIDGGAPFVQLEWIQPYTDALNIGFQGSFSFFHADASRRLSTFTAGKSRTDYTISYTDTYDLQGAIPPLAPYAGSPAGPGILLTNIPVSRVPVQTAVGGETASAFNSIGTDFDLNLSSLSLGPVIEYNRSPWALQASLGLTVNVASWDADQNETLFVRRDVARATAENQWRDHDSDTDILAGFFLQAAVSRQLNESWSINVFGRYDWIDDLDFQAGPSTGTADLSGWSLGVGVGFNY